MTGQMCVSPQRLPEMAEGRRGLFLERLVVDPPDLADKRAEKEALPLATSAVDDSYPWAGGWALSESKEVAPLVVAIEEALGSKLVHSVPSEVVTGLTVTRPTTMSRSTQRPTCGHEKSPPRSKCEAEIVAALVAMAGTEGGNNWGANGARGG